MKVEGDSYMRTLFPPCFRYAHSVRTVLLLLVVSTVDRSVVHEGFSVSGDLRDARVGKVGMLIFM